MTVKIPSSPEHRQHINLSQYAYDIIENDSQTFMGRKNISGFINTILEYYGESYYDEAYNNRALYSKDVTLKIRLNKNNYEDIYYPENKVWNGAKYKITQSECIKAILEDYSRKTIYNREGIFFYKDNISKINNHINSKQEKKGLLPIKMTDGKKYYVMPYRISFDYEADFHYLICYSSISPSPRNEYRPASIRISRIDIVKDPVESAIDGNLKNKEVKELERRIKENGVAFIFGDLMEFKICLTQKGLNMYNTIFHQRPMYTDIVNEGDYYVLTFRSTERQITNYFTTFANEATIITPEQTHEWMRNRYYEAWNSYDKDTL